MIDLSKWIYAQDIAEWLSHRPPLDIAEQTDCILSAPHRTFREKLEGLRKLRTEKMRPTVLSALEEYLDLGEYLEEQLCCTRRMFHELYETDIFCCGRREGFSERKIFRAPRAGIVHLKRQIQERTAQCGTKPEEYFGVLYGFCDRTTKSLDHRWSFVTNFNGEVLYCLSERQEYRGRTICFGTGDYHYIRLPYGSGTLLELTDNPFFPPLKGVLVNEAEPWEEAFGRADQWLLYPDDLHDGSFAGIGVIPLNDYASIAFGADFLLPFRQFLRRCEGKLPANEQWLSQLGRLAAADKGRVVSRIRKDSQPKGSSGPYEKARLYVAELEKELHLSISERSTSDGSSRNW